MVSLFTIVYHCLPFSEVVRWGSPPPDARMDASGSACKKLARLLKKSQGVRDGLLQKRAKERLVRPPAASPPRSSRTPEDQQAFREARLVRRTRAQELQRDHLHSKRGEMAALAAAAVFQEPVAPSAQQLRRQLHGLVNEGGVICHALGPEWRAGNEMRVTGAATHLQACSPALEPSRLNTHALL